MTEEEKIIYQLTIEDLQNVANEILNRKLTEEEISFVADKLGDCINWYDAIQDAIMLALPKTK